MLLIKKYTLHIDHASFDTVEEFENAILSDPDVKSVRSISQYWFIPFYYLDKICKKKGFSLIKKWGSSFVLKSSGRNKEYFVVLMGMDFNKYYPYAFLNRKRRYIYLFDSWPKNQSTIADFINKYKIDQVFVSASQAVAGLNEKLKNKNSVHWVPEGIETSEYKQCSYDQKDIDVLNVGRRYELYHEKILPYFIDSDKNYLYEKIKGELVFPTREEFIDGLSRAKISICVPSNLTHPERAGNIETMTIRYLQSIVSKCLIVGYAPQEMIKLFGYNPVIEIEINDPIKQIDAILTNYDDYIPLIEKNYTNVLKYHTWENRWFQIKEVLNKS